MKVKRKIKKLEKKIKKIEKKLQKYKEKWTELNEEAQEIIPLIIDSMIEEKKIIKKIEEKLDSETKKMIFEFEWYAVIGRLQCMIYRIPFLSEKSGLFRRKKYEQYIELLESHEEVLMTEDSFGNFFELSEKYKELIECLEKDGCKVHLIKNNFTCFLRIEW